MNENRQYCKNIALELDAIADGTMYKIDGEFVIINNDDYDVDDCDQVSFFDYIEDALDIEYTIGSDKQYRGCCIMVTCGGPNVYIDTNKKAVTLYWGNDYEEYSLLTDTYNMIDDCMEELYNC